MLTYISVVDNIFFKYRDTKCAMRKEIVTMPNMNINKNCFVSTISYIISRIMQWTVLAILICGLVLSIITGIILIVVQLIISTLIIIGLIISLIQIIKNLMTIKTMTGKSRQILFIQRVEVGANP